MQERVTVLMGAGAMVEATGVSTKTLTDLIIRECEKYTVSTKCEESIVNVIVQELSRLYSKEIQSMGDSKRGVTSLISFEDIFHVLELLPNYMNSGYKGHTSAYQVFTQLNERFKHLEKAKVYGVAHKIIELINDEVNKYDLLQKEKGMWISEFFEDYAKECEILLDVFNLNYDTWMEQILENYNDGFVNIPDYEGRMKKFSFEEFQKIDERHRIAHLHGQICFEHPEWKVQDINRYAFQESTNTLYKYEEFEKSSGYRSRSIHSGDHNQAGDYLFRSNIITGLMKTDKLLWNPMNVYHFGLMESLLKNKKMVIIGYGFSDIYINRLLEQYNSVHYTERKVLIIDYIADEEWEPYIESPFRPSAKSCFTCKLFKEDGWWKNKRKKQDILYSDDKMVCVCTCGFKKVCEEYKEEIIAFMKN